MARYPFLLLVVAFNHIASASWDNVVKILLDHKELAPFNLQIGDNSGLLANITFGDWQSNKVTAPIWSATKLTNGALFFALDAEGVLPLDSKVSDHLDWWTKESSDKRSLITIRHLLNFTSGFDDPADYCIFDWNEAWEKCSKTIYNSTFQEAQFGLAAYKESHLHIAQTIALKVSNASDWSDLWYDKVGKLTGLPQAKYHAWPSTLHPGGGTGMTISANNYAIFLSAFHRSLYSNTTPTTPLKFGPGMGYGKQFFAAGNMFHSASPYIGGGYAYASWRNPASTKSAGLIHSIGCAGWLPGIFPSTASGGEGWWVQLARESTPASSCLGAQQSGAIQDSVVPAILEAVKTHRNTSAPALFHAVHAGVVCKRDAVVEAYCTCPDPTGNGCGGTELCIKGYFTASACQPPYSTRNQEAYGLCSRCEAATTMTSMTTVTTTVTTTTASGATFMPPISTGAVTASSNLGDGVLSSACCLTLFPCLCLLVATQFLAPLMSS